MSEAVRKTGTSPAEKAEQERKKKKVAEYIRTHVAWIELCVTSWQSQSVSGNQNVREWVIVSREYIWLILVIWSAPNARDKIKVADVVGGTNHVTFLTNSFSRLTSLPMSAIFVSVTSESVSHFFGTYWAWRTVREILSDQSAGHVKSLHLYNCSNRVLQIAHLVNKYPTFFYLKDSRRQWRR